MYDQLDKLRNHKWFVKDPEALEQNTKILKTLLSNNLCKIFEEIKEKESKKNVTIFDVEENVARGNVR